MSNLALYACTVGVWGSTWLAIKFQLGVVAPAVSVALRFGLAALVLFVIARIRGIDVRYPPAIHAWLALHGALMYGASYVLVYLSERTLTSGFVAVAFSLIVVLNVVFLRLFFGKPVRPRMVAGAVCGVGGMTLLFWPDLAAFSLSAQRGLAVAYCVAATIIASLGNMTATRNHRLELELVSSTAWSMLYGSLSVATYAALRGDSFALEPTWTYAASLAYLSLAGSVVAFLCYLTLLGRIGADRAGYSGIVIPIVAMIFSSAFEHVQWSGWVIAGMALCLLGNLLVLGGVRRVAQAAGTVSRAMSRSSRSASPS
jgi:drug/metabolite transporter (DMT)-like permease